MVLFLLMFIGGCAGSAGGGPKVVRHLLMARLTLRELRRTLHPRAILPVKLGGRVVPEHILRDVQVFMLFYLLTFAVGTTIVVLLGADLLTGITASICVPRQHRPGLRHDRADGQLRGAPSAQQGRADGRDVDRPPRGPDRAGAVPARGVADRPLAIASVTMRQPCVRRREL